MNMQTLIVDHSLNSKCAAFIHDFLELHEIVSVSRSISPVNDITGNPALIAPDSNQSFSTAGLCNVVRQMLKMAIDTEKCNEKKIRLTSMLGYKQGCLKACAAVSPWTSYCELDLPSAINNSYEMTFSRNVKLQIHKEILKFEGELMRPKKQCNPMKYKTGRKRKQLCQRDGVQLTPQMDIQYENVLPSFFAEIGFLDTEKLPTMQEAKNSDILIGDYALGPYFSIADFIVLFMLLSQLVKMKCICFVKSFFDILPNIHGWMTICLSNEDIQTACLREFSSHLTPRKCTDSCTNETSALFYRCSIEEYGIIDCVSKNEKRSNHKQLHCEINKQLPDILDKLHCMNEHLMDNHNVHEFIWGKLPPELDPSEGGIHEARSVRKRQQIANMFTHISEISRHGDVIVDFCSGGGHLGIVVAYMLPKCQIILVENKEESINRALIRIRKLNLKNIRVLLSNLNYFTAEFNIGISLHACGSATDLVLAKCLEKRASFVISPCCYGSISIASNLFQYPKSKKYQSLISEEKYYLLTRSSDRTCADQNNEYNKEGKLCMILTDTDRILHTIELGYSSRIFSMIPLSCSPKNNIIVGTISK